MVSKIGCSEEIKKEILSRVTGSEKESVLKVSIDKNINKGTIYKWIQEAEAKEDAKGPRLNGNCSSEDKFHMVLETAILTNKSLVIIVGGKIFIPLI